MDTDTATSDSKNDSEAEDHLKKAQAKEDETEKLLEDINNLGEKVPELASALAELVSARFALLEFKIKEEARLFFLRRRIGLLVNIIGVALWGFFCATLWYFIAWFEIPEFFAPAGVAIVHVPLLIGLIVLESRLRLPDRKEIENDLTEDDHNKGDPLSSSSSPS